MKRIILFRFHKKPLICKNRIKLLKKYNPDIDIYGFFGGHRKDFYKMKRVLGNELKSIYCIPVKDKDWKWKNSDLALRLWFRDFGEKVSFDVLYFIEWDLIFFKPIPKIYKNIPKNGVALTWLTPLKKVENRWVWTSKEPYKNEWRQLLDFVKKKFKYNKKPYASLFPGPCLPRKFIEKYTETSIPELCHDELRVPLFAQVLGFKLYDTGFKKRKWPTEHEEKFFNCHSRGDIKVEVLRKELSKASGRRVFHPFRNFLSKDLLSYDNIKVINSKKN